MTIESFLQSAAGVPVEISWHENKRSYLSFRKERKQVRLRLHRLFYSAPSEVHEALANYLFHGDQKGKAVVRKAVHAYFSSHRAAARPLNPIGNAYNLLSIYEKIKNLFFTPDYQAAIGWSPSIRSSGFRHMTFGTYDRHRNQISIHPLLDDLEVPLYFIEFIVYHEMLHAVCEPQVSARGHIRCHTREFRQRERLFPEYAQAKEWEKKSLVFLKKRKLYGRS